MASGVEPGLAGAQIGAEDVTVCRPFLHDTHEAAHHAAEILCRSIGIVDNASRGFKEHHCVDVRGIVQFASAELAHAKHDQAGTFAWRGHVLQFQLAGLMADKQQVVDGGRQRSIRHVAQPARGIAGGEDAREIGKRCDEGKPTLGDPQARHHLVFDGHAALLPRLPAIARFTDEIGQQWLQRF